MCMVSLSLSIYKSLEINIWNVKHTFKTGWGNQRKEYTWHLILMRKFNLDTLAINLLIQTNN